MESKALDFFANDIDKFVKRYNSLAKELVSLRSIYKDLTKQYEDVLRTNKMSSPESPVEQLLGGADLQLLQTIANVTGVLVKYISIYKKMKKEKIDLENKIKELRREIEAAERAAPAVAIVEPERVARVEAERVARMEAERVPAERAAGEATKKAEREEAERTARVAAERGATAAERGATPAERAAAEATRKSEIEAAQREAAERAARVATERAEAERVAAATTRKAEREAAVATEEAAKRQRAEAERVARVEAERAAAETARKAEDAANRQRAAIAAAEATRKAEREEAERAAAAEANRIAEEAAKREREAAIAAAEATRLRAEAVRKAEEDAKRRREAVERETVERAAAQRAAAEREARVVAERAAAETAEAAERQRAAIAAAEANRIAEENATRLRAEGVRKAEEDAKRRREAVERETAERTARVAAEATRLRAEAVRKAEEDTKRRREAVERETAETARKKKADDVIAAAAAAAAATAVEEKRGGPSPITRTITPTIELYEFKIKDYTPNVTTPNKFTKGFISAEDKCGVISVDPDDPNKSTIADNNLSSCDVIETDLATDWEKILGENLGEHFNRGKLAVSGEFISEPNLLFGLIKDLYYEYKHFESRSKIPTLLTDPVWRDFCTLWGDLFKKILLHLTDSYKSLFGSETAANEATTNSYIHSINIDISEKVIMIGDVHGSLHTFLRMLFRFHRFGILDLKTLKLAPGYRLVFLGDVIDRGNFSLEISIVIFFMIERNNADPMNPRIIYNRGNHEEGRTSSAYGLASELSNRCEHGDLYQNLNDTYLFMPSAVILQVKHNSSFYRYWLCHGGFDASFLEETSILKKYIGERNAIIQLPGATEQDNIRWSDFINFGADKKGPLINYGRGGTGLTYDKHNVYQFMTINKIDFIIRGHQDSFDNNYLYATSHMTSSGRPMPGIGLNIGNLGVVNEKLNKELVTFNEITAADGRRKGPIATLVATSSAYDIGQKVFPDKTTLAYYYGNEYNADKTIKNETSEIYPVLTISTNTDIDRPLRADSFALLRFDKTPENPNVLTPTRPLPQKGGYYKKYLKYKRKYNKLQNHPTSDISSP
ncbi:MAG: calcineurin-like phosphoesterase [Hyperionvirus sp.]|uniref:protein-serine/threonine phosphatase n=1 Tax=Hyperionvirus sp. TaxID=2487770 RepID=A0A3G5ACJ1_9VIRU|nr:MAG: calcineurin-like phosphoesterase [Hyperionvirus sp.]